MGIFFSTRFERETRHDLDTIKSRLAAILETQKVIMGTYDDVKQGLADLVAVGGEVNGKIDSVIMKIDTLQAAVAAGSGVTEAQLQELKDGTNAVKEAFAGAVSKIDAELADPA